MVYAVTSELVPNPPRGDEAIARHGKRVVGLLQSARVSARWIGCRTSRLGQGVVDVIEAPDDTTARAAADVIALAHASVEEAA